MRSKIARLSAVLSGLLLLSGCFAGTTGTGAPDRIGVALSFPPTAAMSVYSDDALLLSKLGATETLTVLGQDGTAEPGLAESWTRPHPDTLRMTLRPGMTFHDGTPLTAEHAANALRHAAQATTPPRSLDDVQLRAVATGERTLEVSTGVPDPVLAQRLTSPNMAILSPAAYRENPKAPDPIRTGTGPYVLEDVQGTAGATLRANDRYWGGAPKAAGVDARFISDGTARANALRAGELDVIDTVPVSQLPTISEQEVVELPLPRVVSAHLNTSSGTFADPAMRAAAREAIDPAQLASGVYSGHADAARGLFGPASPWANAARAPRHETPPAAPNGRPVRIATYDERPELPEIASVLAENLRSAGFDVREVRVQEYSTLESELLRGAFDLVVGARSYAQDTGDPVSYLRADWTCAGSYNLSQLCDPAIDAAVERARRAEVRQRQQAAVRISGRLLETDAVVPLVHERARIGLAPGVTGIAEDSYERELITATTTPGT
ncbi:ABC transporter substrate-binding protein [Saccharopolyspora halophila]|uniref:ABC transporter substrate-binding protein n=1 Tax=Saccharopolyspora halophila TaxID=405551 RepID=A0ABP5T0V1_9PSEU